MASLTRTFTTHPNDMKAAKNIVERKGHKLARAPKNSPVKSTGRPSIVPIPRDEPIGLQPDVLERFKHMLRLSHQMDPNYLGELEKLEHESPELYHRYVYSGRRIPELKAYIMVRVSSVNNLHYNLHYSPFTCFRNS